MEKIIAASRKEKYSEKAQAVMRVLVDVSQREFAKTPLAAGNAAPCWCLGTCVECMQRAGSVRL